MLQVHSLRLWQRQRSFVRAYVPLHFSATVKLISGGKRTAMPEHCIRISAGGSQVGVPPKRMHVTEKVSRNRPRRAAVVYSEGARGVLQFSLPIRRRRPPPASPPVRTNRDGRTDGRRRKRTADADARARPCAYTRGREGGRDNDEQTLPASEKERGGPSEGRRRLLPPSLSLSLWHAERERER